MEDSGRLAVLSGPIAAGKTTTVDILEGMPDWLGFRSRVLIEARVPPDQRMNRDILAAEGARLAEDTGGLWIALGVKSLLGPQKSRQYVAVDAVRRPPELDGLRREFMDRMLHVFLTASPGELERRYLRRAHSTDPAYRELARHVGEAWLSELRAVADLVIDTTDRDPVNIAVQIDEECRGRFP